MSHLKGFFKKITGDPIFYDALAKQPIIDAELKLNLFKDVTSLSVSGIENYLKYMTKTVDLQLGEKFLECKELFKKYENKGEMLNPSISHVMGIVFGKLSDIQQGMHSEIIELTQNIEQSVLKPLNDYQREVSMVKDSRKELKEAYDKIEQYRQSLDKAKRDVDNAQRSTTQSSRLTMMGTNDINKKMNEVTRLEEKVQRIEKELDEATSVANEKYDKYTESLYKRIADECDLTNCYLEYLKLQRKYHKQVLKRIESLIPGVKDSLANYNKKPVFGCSLGEYVSIHNNLNNSNAQYQQQQQQLQQQSQNQQPQLQLYSRSMMNVNNVNSSQDSQQYVSPVIRKLIEGMCKQSVFTEEGIFRVAGSRIKMNCLLYAINAGYLEYLDFANDFDVHCLAGVLKQYIRELPDSILCNGLYDYWINAINTSPPNKLDAFRNVLNRLPRTNYENLKYLIKFLSKIVENSEKTKMTTTNMGICFGVSLISSNNQSNGHHHQLSSASSTHMAANQLSSPSSLMLNSNSSSNHHHNNENVIMSTKLIDMATATNVFDFLLTNHNELFPGDVNFGSNSLAQRNASFYHRQPTVPAPGPVPVPNNVDINYKHSPSNQHLTNSNSSVNTTPNSTNSINNSLASISDHHSSGGGQHASHRHSVMLNDSLNTSLNDSQSTTTSATSQLQNSSYSKFSTAASPSSSLNINHINRHVKNNSMDIRYLDVGENNSPPTPVNSNSTITSTTTSNNINNNQNKASNVVVGAAFPSLSTQINASSTVSLDTGSGSPKLKAKKQAPAPPRQNQNDAQCTQNSSLSTSLIESTHSLSSNSSIHNISASNNSTSATKPLNISNEGLSTASTTSSSINNNNISSGSGGNPNNLITKLTIEAKNQDQSNVKTADVDSASSSVSSTSSLSVPTLPIRSVSLKQHDLGSLVISQSSSSDKNNSSLIEKPNQPPPQIPANQSVRQPPPIGFNISILGSGASDTLHDSPPLYDHKTPPYPTTGSDLTFPLSPPDLVKQHSPEKSDLDPNGANRSTGPKPAVPRRPGNVVSAHLSKFQRLVDSDPHESTTIDPPEQQSKSLSEITSL